MEILLIFPGFILAIIIVVMYEIKLKKPRNKVHFYVARDKNNELWLYIGKPIRRNYLFTGDYNKDIFCLTSVDPICFGINENDYADLKWEDEPVEVFLNMED